MRVTINLNDQVKVKPTAKGLALLQAEHVRLFGMYQNPPPVRGPDADGVMTMALWDVMQTFGPGMSLGFDNVIETDIELKL